MTPWRTVVLCSNLFRLDRDMNHVIRLLIKRCSILTLHCNCQWRRKKKQFSLMNTRGSLSTTSGTHSIIWQVNVQTLLSETQTVPYMPPPLQIGSSWRCRPSGRRCRRWVRPGKHTAPPTPFPDGPCSSGDPPCRTAGEDGGRRAQIKTGSALSRALNSSKRWTSAGTLFCGSGGGRSRKEELSSP